MNSNLSAKNYLNQIDFDTLQSLDIFFTYDKSPVGAIIRVAEAGFSAIYDGGTVNHAGLIARIAGQVFAVELTPSGIRLNSIDIYRKDSNFIAKVYRFYDFSHYSGRTEAAYNDLILAVRRNQDKGYDFGGAIRSIPLFNNIYHLFSRNDAGYNSEDKQFCSEDVYDFLVTHGANFPMSWWRYPPNPLMLQEWMEKHPDIYKEIKI